MNRDRLDSRRSRSLVELLALAAGSDDPTSTLEAGATEWKGSRLGEAAQSCARALGSGERVSRAVSAFVPDRFVAAVESGEIAGDAAAGVDRALRLARREARSELRIDAAVLPSLLLVSLAFVLFVVGLVVLAPVSDALRQELGALGPEAGGSLVSFVDSHRKAVLIFSALAGLVPLLLTFGLPSLEQNSRLGLLLLRIPVLGSSTQRVAFGNFAETLADLLEAGVVESRAAAVAARTLRNRALADRLASAEAPLAAGDSLRQVLEMARLPERLVAAFDSARLTNPEGFAAVRRVAEEERRAGEEEAGLFASGLSVWGLFVAGLQAFALRSILLSPILSADAGW